MSALQFLKAHYFAVGTGIALAVILFIGLSAFRSGARDDQRIADLNEIAATLKTYYLKFHNYPKELSELISVGVGVRVVPEDPLSPKRNYAYAVDENGQNYILSAMLEDGSNPKLKNDIDGIIYKINCDDRPSYNYCVNSF